MAQVIVSGLPLVTAPPLSAGDLEGMGLVGGLGLSFVSLSSVSIAPGGARSSDNTLNILVSAPLTVDLTVAGAGGLDTGVEAPSTFYFVYVIADSTGVNPAAGLLSISSSSPTLPAGYDKFRRVGTVRNNAGSDIIDFLQHGSGFGREVFYDDGIANRNVLSAGAAVPVTAVDLSAFVPPTSRLAYMHWRQSGTPPVLLYSDPAHAAIHTYTGLLAGTDAIMWIVTSPAQAVAYSNFGGGGSLDAWLIGYKETI